MLAGFVAGGLVIDWWRPHYAGALTWSVGVGFALGVCEVFLLRALPRSWQDHLTLDGMLFPFFSLGVGGSIIAFQ